VLLAMVAQGAGFVWHVLKRFVYAQFR